VENYTEVFVFKYEQLHPKVTLVYGNDKELAIFDEIVYYERILSEEEIADGLYFDRCFFIYTIKIEF
jgi:hypothetical protein